MNNTKQTFLNDDQKRLIAEFAATYAIDPGEITFFTEDPTAPFFSYEATCILCNRLTDIRGIDIEPINNGFVDSVSYRCTLTFDAGVRSAVGVANVDEKDSEGKTLKPSQLIEAASGRAIRNALRVAGINLVKLHYSPRGVRIQLDNVPQSNYNRLLAQSHILGKEAGLIMGEDKAAWYQLLKHRYGVGHTSSLDEAQLVDWTAFLRALAPPQRHAA